MASLTSWITTGCPFESVAVIASYIVNYDQVKVFRCEKESIFLELGIDRVSDIPISKTYSEKVTSWFQPYSA